MAMAVGATQEGEPMSEINTTPLIDVMLVLLIMLIVTLPPQRHAVKLDTPREAPPTMDDPPKPIRVTVEFDGAILWNGALVSYAELDSRLAAESRRPMQPE